MEIIIKITLFSVNTQTEKLMPLGILSLQILIYINQYIIILMTYKKSKTNFNNKIDINNLYNS